MTTATKNFKPVLMYIDQERIDLSLKSAKEMAEKLNSKFREVEKFFDRKLSDEELYEVAKGGIRSVDEIFMNAANFPKATKEFNLEASGQVEAYEEIKKSLMNTIGIIHSYDFEIREGVVSLTEKGENAINEMYTFHTSNEAQNEALELSRSMVEDLNTAIDKSWIGRLNLYDIQRNNCLVKASGDKFIPHYGNIKSMNEEGRRMS